MWLKPLNLAYRGRKYTLNVVEELCEHGAYCHECNDPRNPTSQTLLDNRFSITVYNKLKREMTMWRIYFVYDLNDLY